MNGSKKMARLPRLSLAGIPQHVIQRGNNRQACFFSEQDYTVYLDKLSEYSKKHNVHIHSYILMTNHVHLLLTPMESNGVSQLMQSLGRYYVRYINQNHGRSGTLWEGRFKSSLIDTERYFFTVSCYIELNPVRASMVTKPEEYPWSSYQQNAMGKHIKIIVPHASYLSLGNNDLERQVAYKLLFKDQISDVKLKKIRDAINKTWVLGSNKFKKQIELQTGRSAVPLTHGGDRKSEKYLIR